MAPGMNLRLLELYLEIGRMKSLHTEQMQLLSPVEFSQLSDISYFRDTRKNNFTARLDNAKTKSH